MNFFLPYKWFKAEDYYGQNLMVPYKLLESRNIKKHTKFLPHFQIEIKEWF